ncbi:SHOCT domain-containing protein [Nocardia sp. NPDC051787]|uniref:SHOCT domain-containing protein n=1 Tax=Nocardia sp. NPDC051787 TaxID=3155415 RepID=UPI00343DB690
MKETALMYWHGNGMTGWGFGLMTVSMVIFWALIIAGIVVLVRYTTAVSQRQPTVPPPQHGPTPQQVLAERYARGEIDDEEYTRRLKTLNSATST